jgi:response regulator RpfG family c-di-GMP phosphodiesterase
LDLANGPEEAVQYLADQGPYAVVVSDMQMPNMTGIELLAYVRRTSPNTVRMMLTGNADQKTAVDAINSGHIFRFLNKPCPAEKLVEVLDAGLEQYRLIVGEKELLSKTLSGSVALLTEVLSLVNPTAFSQAGRARRLAHFVCQRLGVEQAWQIEMAAMLSQVGCVTIPAEIVKKYYYGEPLNPAEQELVDAHPKVGAELVAKIPRLEIVSKYIAHQRNVLYEIESSNDLLTKDEQLGAKILKVVLDYELMSMTASSARALHVMRYGRDGHYDLAVLHALAESEGVSVQSQSLAIAELEEGMILDEHVFSSTGELLVAEGHEVTQSVIIRLKSYAKSRGVREPIRVRYPSVISSQPQTVT